jgi:hypothetical protein
MAQDDVVRNVEWAVVTAQSPGRGAISAGILLVDRTSDELYVKLLPELSKAEDEVAEFWRELPRDLLERSKAIGGSQVLSWLETTASHLIQLGPRSIAKASDPADELELLYYRYVIRASNVAEPIAQVRSIGR